MAASPLAAPPRAAMRLPAALREEHDEPDDHDDGEQTATA